MKVAMEMEKMRVVMMPFLAHGHISRYFELAKRLAHTNLFQIYFLSTPICLEPIRNHQFDDDHFYKFNTNNNIQLIDLHLLHQDDDGGLPPHYHSTKNLPPHLFNSLFATMDSAKPTLFNLLKNLNPHLLIFDFFLPWAAEVARDLNIHHVLFLTSFAARKLKHGVSPVNISNDVVNGMTMIDRYLQSLAYSSKMVLVKTSREIEGGFDDIDVVVGPIVQRSRPSSHDDQKVINWLEEKEEGSVVFVSLGTENYFSEEEMEEMAKGLELSGVDFIWVVRFHGERKPMDFQGFLERTKGRGLVVNWAPQVKVLSHENIGAFLSHCGWNSILESMYYGVPVLAMPIHLDQPYNGNVAVKVGVGMEVKRYDQKLKREDVANVVRRIIVEEEGKKVREKAKELSRRLKEIEDEEFNEAVMKIINLLQTKHE